MNLSELQTGSQAVITSVEGSGAFRKRIIEMGFVRGKTVLSIKNAPLNDPIEYKIFDYHVSLRREEAKMITIAPLGEFEAEKGNVNIEEMGAFDKQHSQKTIKIALVGNPNCGKTTIFNNLSGANEHTGNYSGVTVGATSVAFKFKEYNIEIVDLPGTYSISAYSPEEIFVRNTLINYDPDIVLNVIDASNLARNLYLTTQLIDMGERMVCALNMYDDFEKSGDQLDYMQLSKLLGVAMVPTVGSKSRGLDALLNKVVDVYEGAEEHVRRIRINYGTFAEETIAKMVKIIDEKCTLPYTIPSRYLAVKLLENEMDFVWEYAKCEDQSATIACLVDLKNELANTLKVKELDTYMTDSRYGFVDGALSEVYVSGGRKTTDRSSAIDKILTHKVWGIPIFICFMWIMFECTYVLGEYPMDWIDMGVEWLSDFLSETMPDGPVKDLVIDGIIAGVGSVIVFLPNILILFLFISFMEDTGYLARAAFIMDKCMHKMGLHGKSFIPLIMGFGCNVPAIMATRTIEDKGNRMLTILITPFMSCTARLPVYLLFCAALFPENPGTMLLVIYLIGICVSVLACRLYKRFLITGKDLPFVMELPPYRMPTLRSTLINMWSKASQYLSKMGGIILVAAIIIWFLGYYPQNEAFDEQHDTAIEFVEANYAEDEELYEAKCDSIEEVYLAQCQEYSILGRIGKAMEPTIAPLGYDWKMGVSLIAGVAAKEIVISSLAVLYATDEEEGLVESIQNEKREGKPFFNKANVFSYMIFTLLYFPCMAAIAAVKNEASYGADFCTGEERKRKKREGWKWAIFVIIANTIFAYVFAFLAYNIMNYFI